MSINSSVFDLVFTENVYRTEGSEYLTQKFTSVLSTRPVSCLERVCMRFPVVETLVLKKTYHAVWNLIRPAMASCNSYLECLAKLKPDTKEWLQQDHNVEDANDSHLGAVSKHG